MANDYKSQTCKNCKYHFCYQEESSECSSADTHPAATAERGQHFKKVHCLQYGNI